ncbi:nuclear transport factor 2 family protein [Rhodococcus sp. B50]|uniref:nuclear transport factor 2 family protein n=1 Tax=Rhodococcus sp. B50 TaxID=2682847 RepID=UPI001BD69470|nr:nuclear transport factor 2 family protein [Rhodococcus sp. B50]MBS9376093.1 hypothetical protein [Rhodococcus sp. B50]
MDLDRVTTTSPISDDGELRLALRTLADVEAIKSLAALYATAVDDHDLKTVIRCFDSDGSFTRNGETVTGHQALRTYYRGLMDYYSVTLHSPGWHVVTVEARGSARGLQTGHAESVLNGELIRAAYRYDDRYLRRQDGRWVFAARTLSLMYVLPEDQMSTGFRDEMRIRVPGTTPRVADYPEPLHARHDCHS